MSCTSAVCIVALLVATINSSVAETRILPAFVSASPQRVGPERKAKELFTQPFVLVRPQCLPRRECPSWRALPCVGGWVGGVEWSGVGWGGVGWQDRTGPTCKLEGGEDLGAPRAEHVRFGGAMS